MIDSMLNQNQRQQVNDFKTLTDEQKASKIADLCNSRGISLEELKKLYNALK